MAGFDVEGARKAGYSDAEIADYLAPQAKFDTTAARKAGYDDSEIVGFLSSTVKPVEEKGGLINSYARENSSAMEESKYTSQWAEDLAKNIVEIRGVVPGAMSGGATALKGAAALQPSQTDLLAASDTGGFGFANVFPDKVNTAPRIPTEETPLYQAGKSLQETAEKTLPAAKGMENSVGRNLAEGVGSLLGGVAVSAFGGPVTGAAYFAAQGSGEAVDRAIRAGATEDQILKAAAGGLLPGITDSAPIEVLLGRIPGPTGAIARMIPPGEIGTAIKAAAKIGWQALIEGIQEGGQEFLQNVIAKDIYKPDQQLTENVLPNAAGGAGVGAIAEVGKMALEGFAGRHGARMRGLLNGTEDPGQASRVDDYIATRDRQLTGEPAPIAETPILPPQPEAKVAVAEVLDAPDLDTAIDAATRASEITPVGDGPSLTESIAAGKEMLDKELPNPQLEKLGKLFQGLNEGEVEKLDDNTYVFKQRPGEEPISLRVWDPDTAPATSTAISPEIAKAQRDYYTGEHGIDVVYFENDDKIPFDGVVDPTQPNTLFLSNDPTRNALQVGAHEFTHLLEDVKGPDGESLADILHQQIAGGITDVGWDYAKTRFGTTAPERSLFGEEGPEGDAAHAQAVTAHFIKELAGDIGGEAPEFDTFIPKVMSEVESRYGKNVAAEMFQKFMDGIRSAMETIKRFFADGSNTVSQHLVTNLDQIHTTLAKMYAAKYGEAFEDPDTSPELSKPFERVGPAPKPGYEEAKVRATNLKRWLGELDTKRREDAKTDPDVVLLQAQEHDILRKVGGVEERLTKAAAQRLAFVREKIDEKLNPKGDNYDMARVREAMVREHEKMAKYTAVSKKQSPKQQGTPEFKKWFGKSHVTDDKGTPLVVYHGTPADFHAFDQERGNPESDFGAGIYFTNNRNDVGNNYAGMGPDLTSKIELAAERIAQETDRDYDDPDVKAEARARFVQHEGATMPVYLKMENPFKLGGKDESFLDYSDGYNHETEDYDGQETGKLVDFVVALRNEAESHGADPDPLINKIMEEAAGNEGISASRLEKLVREDEDFNYAEGDEGQLVSHELYRRAIEAAGFDGIIDRTANQKFGSERQKGKSMAGMDKGTVHYIAFRPEQVKSAIGNSGKFNPKDPRIAFSPKQAALKKKAAKDEISKPGVGVDTSNAHGFAPSLRVKVSAPPKFELNKKDEPVTLLTQTTTNGNAAKQLENLDKVLEKFPDATSSPVAWSKMMAYALGSDEVPIPPYAFIRDLNSDGATKKVASLSQGQINDANHGFEQAAAFRKAYESGSVSPITTGKLFLWSFLSRGVSPYVQEGLFIDAFDGAAPWIKKAVDGDFSEKNLPAYEAWARTAAPKGSGQPGAGATHNLNAFGANFLLRMSRRDENGSSHLQRLHDMMSDPKMTGQQIRREFLKFGESVGIDNKVVSFTMLVAGHSDVMVIDRVQTRQLWDDGQFANVNIYDGQKNAEGKVITGTPLANLTYGVRGLLAYEAIEKGLQAKIKGIYEAAGRPQDASVGRYHWESWVAYSQQEANHGTLGAILEDAIRPGDKSAIVKVAAKQGEYGAYEYGAKYGRDRDGAPYFQYTTPSGRNYEFSVPAFRAFLEDIKRPAVGVVPSKFKVTESGNGPWYDRPEVDQAKLDAVALQWADRGDGEGALRGAQPRGDDARGSRPPGRPAEQNAAGLQFSPKVRDDGFFTARRLRADRAGDERSSVSYTRRSGDLSERERILKTLGVETEAEWVAGPELRRAYEDIGVKVPARVFELKRGDAKSAEVFQKAISNAKADNRFGAAVAVYPAEDYAGFRLLLSDDGKSGAAVKPDGDIISVFSTAKGGRAMMEAAIAAGGRKLDAFDTVLPKLYHDFGFVEAGRVGWNDEYAPEGWDKATFEKFNNGRPDVVLMVLDRNDTSPVLEKSEVYPSWDDAAAAQEAMLKQMDEESPAAVINLRLDRLDGGKAFSLEDATEAVEGLGAQVVATGTREIGGGENGVVMHLSRPLSEDELTELAKELKQEAVSQMVGDKGEVHGPKAENWGPFDPEKFYTIAAQSPRVTPEIREKLKKIIPDFEKTLTVPAERGPKVDRKKPILGNKDRVFKANALKIADEHDDEVRAIETEALRNVAEKAAGKVEPPVEEEEDIKPPRRMSLQPIEGTGRERERAINGAVYNVGEEQPQMDRAARLVERDRAKAIRIAMRQEAPPTGVHPEFVFMAVEEMAKRENDYKLEEQLSRSRIAEEATTMGQRIAAWRNRLEISPVEDMRRIREAREARLAKAEDVDKETAKIVKAALAQTRRQAIASKKPSLNQMILSIICKV